MEEYYIYIHRKKTNNEVFYIGKGKGYRAYDRHHRSDWWKKVVEKHGFIVEKIVENISEELALLAEIELIDAYKKRGYKLINLTNGGDGISGYKKSEESKKKMSDSAKKRSISSWDWNRGINAIAKKPEVKEKMSISAKKRIKEKPHTLWGGNTGKGKKVMCVETSQTFESLKMASEWLKSQGFANVSNKSICAVAKGHRNSLYGFHWRYVC